MLFAINYLRVRFATGILGGETTGAPEADSVATKIPSDGETLAVSKRNLRPLLSGKGERFILFLFLQNIYVSPITNIIEIC